MDCILLESFVEGKDVAIGNFVKFGGGMALHHNSNMLKEFLYVGITSCLLVGVSLPILEVGHDPPLCTVNKATRYITLQP
jgi:hypothetical protein